MMGRERFRVWFPCLLTRFYTTSELLVPAVDTGGVSDSEEILFGLKARGGMFKTAYKTE